MKHTISLLLLALLWLPMAHATEPATLAQQADDLYRSASYPEAIAAYEEVLAQGYSSAELYYNLGNAYYREQQLGKAILNYERALRLRPGMEDARHNLQVAADHTTDRIIQLPVLFVVGWWNTLTTHIPPVAWRWVVLLLLALLGVAVVLFVEARQRTYRRVGFASLLVGVPLLLLAVALLWSATNRFNAHDYAIVLEPISELKNSPEVQSNTRMSLHEGTKVRIAEALPDWYQVTLADGTVGWLMASDVERI